VVVLRSTSPISSSCGLRSNRHRLLTTGRDQRGHVAALGGRVLRDEDVPKCLNSPKTPLFDKSAILFGLDMARETIRRWDQAVIVEGYKDVLQAH
jgi:DNA primase